MQRNKEEEWRGRKRVTGRGDDGSKKWSDDNRSGRSNEQIN